MFLSGHGVANDHRADNFYPEQQCDDQGGQLHSISENARRRDIDHVVQRANHQPRSDLRALRVVRLDGFGPNLLLPLQCLHYGLLWVSARLDSVIHVKSRLKM